MRGKINEVYLKNKRSWSFSLLRGRLWSGGWRCGRPRRESGGDVPSLLAIVASDYTIRLVGPPLRRIRCRNRGGGPLLKSRRLAGRLVDGGDGFCHLLPFSSVLLERRRGRKCKISDKEINDKMRNKQVSIQGEFRNKNWIKNSKES